MVASWPGTKMVSRRENYLMLLTPMGPLNFGMAHSTWPSISGLTPDVLFPRSLDFGSHQHEISGCELKLQTQSFNFGWKGPGKK